MEESTQLGAIFRNQQTGEVESYAHWAPTALQAHEQLELTLPGLSARQAVRQALAAALEHRALPEARNQQVGVKMVTDYVERLRRARHTFTWGYSLAKGKTVMLWDEKAGLSRLCPDDAREEAQRLSRRVLGPLEEHQAAGRALHYAVFTTPNAAPGGLRKEMASICRRFRALILKSGHFPEVQGAVCVLEAPLGSARDWNVHLNVILVVKGFLDYEKLRRHWWYNVHARKLAEGPGVVKGALTELIKYAVAATVAKSAEKAVEGAGGGGGEAKRIPPPPMLEWTGAELLEWLRAMRGFRRTRTYGCLFRLKRPEPDELGQVIWLGWGHYDGREYRQRSALLDSITEDKSSGIVGPAAYVALLRGLALGGLRGAGRLGESISRDWRHKIDETPPVL